MQSYISKIIVLLIGSLAFFAPIRPDLGWLFATPEVLKTFWGVMGVLMIIFLWLILSYRKSKITIQKSNIYLPLFIFILWCFITLIWVEDGYLAAIMLAQFTSAALMYFIVSNLVKKSSFYTIVYTLIFSMTLVSLIGLIQFYFGDNIIIYNIFGQSVSPASTFGNKNMASHFLVIVLPLNLIFLIKETSKKRVVIYSTTLTISLWYLIFIAARQAYLAFGIELILLVLFLVLDYWKNREKSIYHATTIKAYKVNIAVLIIILLSIVANSSNTGTASNKLERLRSINIEAGGSRIPAWVNTIELIKDNFWTGVGIGQWPETYPQYYDKVQKDVIFNEKVRLKRLHNDYLETFSNVGFIGFLVLIWISFLIMSKIFRIILNPFNPNRFKVFSIGLGLVGFCVVAFFSFPARVYLPIFLVLVYFGLIENLSEKRHRIYEITNKKTILLIFFVFSLIAIYIGSESIKWIKAGNNFFIAKIFLEIENPDKTLHFIDLALRDNPLSPESYFIAGNASVLTGDMNKAEVLMKKAVDISPFNTQSLLNLAIIYNIIGKKDMEKRVLDFIISFDERNVRALAGLTQIFYKEKDMDNATVLYQRLKDSFTYFNERSNFGPYNDVVGLAAMSVGDYQYAEYVYQDALSKKDAAQNYVKLATVKFYNMGKKEEGIQLYKRALFLDSNIPNNKKIKALIQEYESITKR